MSSRKCIGGNLLTPCPPTIEQQYVQMLYMQQQLQETVVDQKKGDSFVGVCVCACCVGARVDLSAWSSRGVL